MLFNTLNLIYLNVTMPNLTRKIFTQISLAGLYHNGIILYQWEFLRARLDEGEGLPWIAMEYPGM